MDDPSKDSLEELGKRLYQRGQSVDFEAFRSKLSKVRSSRTPEPKRFEGAVGHSVVREERQTEPMSYIKKILIGSTVFFVTSLILAGLFIFGTLPNANSDAVDISVSGPVSVRGGSTLPIQITFKNTSRTDFEFSDMTVDFPEGSRDPRDSTRLFPRYDETVGALGAGQSVTKAVEALVYGDENEQKEVKIVYDYRPAGSSSLFRREKSFSFSILSSPVSLSVSLPHEVNSNHELAIEIKASSNASEVLHNVLLEALYPPGFAFKSATLDPVFANKVWRFGDLAPGKVISFSITGVLEGQDNEEKLFRFTAGSAASAEDKQVAVPYTATSRSVAIRRPFLGLSLGLPGGDTPNVPDGASVSGSISLVNNLADTISNLHLEMQIDGKAVNMQTVSGTKAFWKSSEHKLLWDSSTGSGNDEIAGGDTKDFSFGFDTYPSGTGGTVDTNRTITLTVLARGFRVLAGSGSEEVSETLTRTVKLSSLLGLSSRAVYTTGPFKNTGPLPPTVDTKTTYTIIWSLANSANSANGVTVETRLPASVEWLGAWVPGSDHVTYNPDTRGVRWTVGTLPVRVGYGSLARELSFQVALTPSVSQRGTEPVLTGETTAAGTDDFTKQPLTSIKRELTTRIDTDPKFTNGQSFVK